MLTTGANDQSSSFSGNIQNGTNTGTVALTKTGTGNLTLAGNNTYSGATTIATGTLTTGSTTGLSPNSTLTISGPGTLNVNGYNVTMDGLLGTGTINNNGAAPAVLTAGAGGANTSFGGVIADGSNTLALTKSGTGTLTLTGVNTYSGTTTISNGTISVANPGAGGNLGTASSAIVLGAATTKGSLSYTGTSDLTITRGFDVLAGGGEVDITTSGKLLTMQTGGISAAGTFTVGGDGNASIQSVITGAGGFTKTNTGTMVIGSANTYAGNTTVSTGTLQLTNAAAIPSGTGKGNLTVNSTLDVNNLNITVNGLSGSGTITNSQGSPVTLTVGDNSGSGNFAGILQDGVGTMALTKIGSGLITISGTNTYSGNTAINGGTLQIGKADAIPNGAYKGNIAVATDGTLDLNNFDITVNGLSGAGLVTNNHGASMLAAGGNDQTSTFTGNIRDGSGTIGLTKTGTGILTLSGNNTFSGVTTISQGTVSMGSNTGLSPHSTLTIDNAGALDLNGHVIAIDGLAGSGSITNNSATAVNLTTGASGGSGSFGGTINDGTGVIALTKTGAGTVTLTHVNTYSGGTTVTGGLLAITSYGALGAIPASPTPGNIVLNGGGISASNTFEINSNRGIAVGPASGSGTGVLDAADNQTLTYNGIIANNGAGIGGLTKTGEGTVTLGGVNTYSGDTMVSTGSLQIGANTAIPSGSGKGNLVLNATLDLNNTSITVNGLSGSGLVSNTRTGTVTLSAGANDQTSTFDGVLENKNGTTALTKVGTGVLTLTGTNTYGGTTTIAAGTMKVSRDANLGRDPNTATPGNIVINAAATLAATDTFTLATTRGIAVGPSGAGIVDVATNKTLTYGGAIANNGGSGGFTKDGSGTLILTGTSSYTGTTTVVAGILTVNGSNADSGSGFVRSGATLTGTGTTGAMTIDAAGTLAPGNAGIGALAVVGGLVLNGNTDLELGTPGSAHNSPGLSDRVNVTGSIQLGGNLNLTDNAGTNGQGSLGAGSYKLLTYTDSASGSFATVNGLSSYHTAVHDMTADKAVYLDLYNYAVATITPSVDLGRIHAGGDYGTRILTAANTAASGAFTESLGGAFDSPTTGITAIGSVTGIAGQAHDSNNMVVGISDTTAGSKSGTVAVNFISQAVSSSGLSNTSLAAQSVAVTGFAYTGQSTWNIAGSGSWGNNSNAYGNWIYADGVPGLDGTLSANDTATFGDAINTPTTVSLNGASPSLSAITFNNAANSYTLAKGSSGTLTIKGNGGAGTITDAAGNHTISAPVTLASNASVVVSNRSDTFTITGAITGSSYGITKNGAGTLILTGTSSYTGTTTVTAGVLTVNGSVADSGSGFVRSGATLTGTGTTGTMTIDASGTLAPGNAGIGALAVVGGLVLNGNSDFELGTPGSTHASPGLSDRVNVTGSIQLGGNLNLTDNTGTNGQGSLGAGSYKLLTYSDSVSGSFAAVNGLSSYHTAVHDVTADKAVYLDLYNYAVPTITPSVDLGRIHAGGDYGTQKLTAANTQVASAFTESLGGTFGTTTTGITAIGSVTGIAGQAHDSNNMAVGISDTTAGSKSGTVAVNFISQAVSSSGLSNTTLAAQSVAVTGFAYTGQSTWNIAGSGSWGNNSNAYGNWIYAGGVPGLDGTLSANDTATFGGAINTPTTVSLNGASPSLSAITFNNAANSYTLAKGSSGTLTIKGNGGAGTISDTAGNHTISAPVTLASNASVAVSNRSDTFTITGAIAGSSYGITKNGAGTLTLTGTNTYTGTTAVQNGVLMVNGSLANTTTTVANHATLSGTGTLSGPTTINAGGSHSPGNPAVNGGIGTQSFTNSLRYASGAIMTWDLNGATFADVNLNQGSYDQVQVGGSLTANSGAVFNINLSNSDFSSEFWNNNRSWDNIFTGSGVTLGGNPLFTTFNGAGGLITSNGTVNNEGRFYFTGATLNWTNDLTPIPEPGSLLALGCLIGSGVFLRTRRRTTLCPTAN